MAFVTMRQLLEAGIHFGHQTRRWNPKMSRYIFGQRNGIYIIDLQKTYKQLHKAYVLVRNVVAEGGDVLFVGTKKQAQDPVAHEAQRCGMYYVNNRWLGGTLTNYETVKKSIRGLLRLEEMETNGKLDALHKKEAITLRKERVKLNKNLAGIKRMTRLPDVVFVIDAKKEAIAVREAQRLGIPCIGIVDTNCDPDSVPIPIPGNDDAIRAVSLFCQVMADAVLEGRMRGEKVREEARARDEQLRKERALAAKAAATEAKAEEELEQVSDEAEQAAAKSVADAETAAE
ncbi:MAG: 30S ribosomal protein S2 [Candidatus Hydrogenedentes bacterium]|nr:30S ribosomal protein S2 [Candidatus Hydrogenedentota bacterium]